MVLYKSVNVSICAVFVAVDENEKRRDIVRKKTAKYLMKAESLHTKYLSGGESTDHWDVSPLCPSLPLPPLTVSL